jgi:hypothetical protein
VRRWLVAHLVRDEGVAGSNPANPTGTQPIPDSEPSQVASQKSRPNEPRHRTPAAAKGWLLLIFFEPGLARGSMP